MRSPRHPSAAYRHRAPAGRDAAKAASLLRAHGRLGHRRRGRAAGRVDQGGRGASRRRRDRQSRRLAVPHRAQHRAGFPAPPQPAGSASIGRGAGHDCRPGRCRREPPDRGCEPAHLHAAAGRAALQRDPDGRARLLAAGGLRGDGFQPAGGEGGAASRARAAARTRRRARRYAAAGTIGSRSRAPRRLCRRISTPAISMPSAP